ncbi:MAG: rRNA pseudouridine synthase [Bacteroidales bacterium]|nr:rRNA pseudouridine synthase [Candidatus Colicola faecequi]
MDYNNNQNGENQPYRSGGYRSGREGYQPRQNRYPSSENRDGGSERPRFQSDERARRPRINNNMSGSYQQRPRFLQQGEGGYQQRPRFQQQGEGGYQQRPRFQQQGEGGYQQRPRFQQGEGGYQQRPRFQQGEGGYQQRPRFQQSEGGYQQRPRFQQDNEGGYQQGGQRPRMQRRPQGNPSLYSRKKRVEYQEKYEDPTKPIRLNKYLANAGICSRREADDFILAGVITVNGMVVSELGAKVLPTDKVMFHDQPVRREKKVYILLNKPKNTVTTTDDPQERHTVIDIVKNACAERIYPVGRLDRNTTGVLLLTNDGDLAAKLTHPKFGKKKIYAATLDKDLSDEAYNELMAGVVLDDELIVPDALEFPKEGDRKHVGLQIHSGQNRVVRRMFEKVGYKVVQLDRVSFAGLTKKNVPRGKYRFLTQQEVSMLQMGAFE